MIPLKYATSHCVDVNFHINEGFSSIKEQPHMCILSLYHSDMWLKRLLICKIVVWEIMSPKTITSPFELESESHLIDDQNTNLYLNQHKKGIIQLRKWDG